MSEQKLEHPEAETQIDGFSVVGALTGLAIGEVIGKSVGEGLIGRLGIDYVFAAAGLEVGKKIGSFVNHLMKPRELVY